jgi:hypothetical protein
MTYILTLYASDDDTVGDVARRAVAHTGELNPH